MRRFVLSILTLVGLVLSANATTWQVTVQDFEFIPSAVTISQGDTVVWTNVLGFHSVFHACGTSLFGNTPATAPWEYQFVFNVPPGVYPFDCQVHPDLMMGTITVQRVPQRFDVNVQNFAFTPADITVQQGDTIVWTNTLGLHSVFNTSTPTRFAFAAAGSPWTYTFVDTMGPGVYPYICQVHPLLMTGNVTVSAPASPPAAPSDVTVHVSGDNATVQWTAISGASCYTIYRSQDVTQTPFSQLIGITGNTSFVQSVSAQPGSKYFYQVYAVGP